MSRKPPTAADRPQFRRDMVKMMSTLKAEVGEVSPETTILCSHKDDFDPADNVLWEHEANKSAVRADVHCMGCSSLVAMSNHAYARFKTFDRKPRVCCTRCVNRLKEEP